MRLQSRFEIGISELGMVGVDEINYHLKRKITEELIKHRGYIEKEIDIQEKYNSVVINMSLFILKDKDIEALIELSNLYPELKTLLNKIVIGE